MPPPETSRVIVDGVEVGEVRVGETLSFRPCREVPPNEGAWSRSGEVALDLSFHPDWVGIWHLGALLLDCRE